MELNIETKQQLEKLLARPALVTHEHMPLLQSLIKAYPYYQPLYLLLAKASMGTENQHISLTNAAIYNNGSILHQVIHDPKKLTTLENANIINYPAWSGDIEIAIEKLNTSTAPSVTVIETSFSNHFKENTEPLIENSELLKDNLITEIVVSSDEKTDLTTTEQEEELSVKQPVFFAPEIENLAPLQGEVIALEEVEVLTNPSLDEEKTEDNVELEEAPKTEQQFIVPEIENLAPLPNEVIKVCEIEIDTIDDGDNDEQETFEEIGEVVIPVDFSTPKPEEKVQVELAPETVFIEEENTELSEDTDISKQEIESVEEITDQSYTIENESNPKDKPSNDDDDLTIESIASTDFFAFEKNFNSEIISEEDIPLQEIKPLEKSNYHTTENIVSKYDDDKLPFTFLWWLTKTRKDHEQIFRPFVSPVKTVTPTTDLQQQYVEHIFHIQSPLDTGEQSGHTNSQKALSKEEELIENFIKNEPQIKVPKPDQINNENKAKKSSEDNYDLVSETLAEIYIEQMLYHKAIDTYQKLSLKFPEKSRYFADLIQSLEKKI